MSFFLSSSLHIHGSVWILSKASSPHLCNLLLNDCMVALILLAKTEITRQTPRDCSASLIQGCPCVLGTQMSKAWLCPVRSPLERRALSHQCDSLIEYDIRGRLEEEGFLCREGGTSWVKLKCGRTRPRWKMSSGPLGLRCG